MPRKKTIHELIAAEQQKREAIDARLAQLGKQAAVEAKAAREKRERQLGRLAYQAGLADMPDDALEAAFKRVAAHTALGPAGTRAKSAKSGVAMTSQFNHDDRVHNE